MPAFRVLLPMCSNRSVATNWCRRHQLTLLLSTTLGVACLAADAPRGTEQDEAAVAAVEGGRKCESA